MGVTMMGGTSCGSRVTREASGTAEQVRRASSMAEYMRHTRPEASAHHLAAILAHLLPEKLHNGATRDPTPVLLDQDLPVGGGACGGEHERNVCYAPEHDPPRCNLYPPAFAQLAGSHSTLAAPPPLAHSPLRVDNEH